MFEKALRKKIRFESSLGLLSVEDLWDLPLSAMPGRPNLDDIARDLSRKIKSMEDESFVSKKTRADETLQLAFDVVKHVITTRLAENEAAKVKRANTEKKQQLLELIAHKENEQLSGKSLDELREMVNSIH